ncbi:MAG: EVE domain-containing protein [Planctomycetota bacterium]
MAKKKSSTSVKKKATAKKKTKAVAAKKTKKKATKKTTKAIRPERKPGQILYWLVKSEPHVFSIDDLAKAADQTTFWDGVRNYQARNTMRDDMKLGDLVLYYHSNAEPPGVAGICKIVREGYPDHTAFDPKDKHYDPKSKKSDPTWYMVDVQLVEKFDAEISLAELKEMSELDGMPLLQKGSRLSVQPVSEKHFKHVQKVGRKKKA